MLPECTKGLFKISEVVYKSSTFDEHVIHIHLHVAVDMLLKNFVDQALVRCSYIFEPKGHNPVTVKTMISNKSSFLLVLRHHPYLVIAEEGIHEDEELMARGCIYQLIDLGRR